MQIRVPHLIIFLLAATCATACSPKDNQKSNPFEAKGVQGSGGGETTKSTAEQVNSALDRALALASEPDSRKNIFVQFWTDWGRTRKNDIIRIPFNLFPNLAADLSAGKQFDPQQLANQFDSPFIKALKTNKIVRLDSGDCMVGAEHKDASVSSFDVTAQICFSIGNIREIPPSALLRETLSLVLHEVTHIGGNKDEDQSKSWQTEFSAYFGARFGDLTTDTVSVRTLKKLSEAKIYLTKAQLQNDGAISAWASLGMRKL